MSEQFNDSDPIQKTDSILTTDNPPATAPADTPKNTHRLKFKPRLDFIFPQKLRTKLGKYSTPLAAILLIIIIGGISGVAYALLHKPTESVEVVERFAKVEDPFTLLSSNPFNNQFNVGITAPITISFNKPVELQNFKNNFFITPLVDGEFKYGDSNNDIVFTPTIPFTNGTNIVIKLQKDIASTSGELLGLEQNISFTTSISSEGVNFMNQNEMSTLYSTVPNKKLDFSIYAGTDVDKNGSISVYKSDVNNLLSNYIYADKTITPEQGTAYTYEDFLSNSVNLTGLKPITTSTGIKDQSTYNFEQPVGVYVIVAASGDKQYGKAWVVVTDKGLLVQQDDKKLLLSGKDLTNNSKVTGVITAYSLKDKKTAVKTLDLTKDIDVIDATYGDKIDMVTATIEGQTVVAPLNVLYSLAHIRLGSDFSSSYRASLMTDKPAYKSNETIKMSGFVRLDNDAQYTMPTKKTIKVFGGYEGQHLFDAVASVDENGRFTAQTVAKAEWIYEGQNSSDVPVSIVNESNGSYTAGSFTVQKDSNSNSTLQVIFSKTEYLVSDTVTATVHGQKSDGSPLSNSDFTYNVYSQAYYENKESNDPYAGQLIGDENQKGTLDMSGNAKITIDLSKISSDSSQLVTIQAKTKDAAGLETGGGGDAVIHAGNGYIKYGVLKTNYINGEETITRLYTKRLDGQNMPNTTVQYNFTRSSYDSSTQKENTEVVETGTVKTDGNGFAEIRQKISGQKDYDSIKLDTFFSDENKNKVQSSAYYYFRAAGTNSYDSHEAQLVNLDISGTDGSAVVGDTVSLTIDSPFDTSALVSLARGRIYKYETIDLKKGTNTYQVKVDSVLAPSFTVWFSYFHDGAYTHEGVILTVKDSSKYSVVNATLPKSTFSTAEAPTVTVNTTDANKKPVQSNLLVSVVNEGSYSTRSVLDTNKFALGWNGYRETTINISSSLLGIGGGGGGRCGGGHGGYEILANHSGESLYFNTNLQTDANGKATFNLPSKPGTWRVTVQSASGTTQFGSTTSTFTVK